MVNHIFKNYGEGAAKMMKIWQRHTWMLESAWGRG